MKKRADGRYRKVVDGKAFYGETEREVYKKILEYTEKKATGYTFKEVAEQWWSAEVEKLSPSTIRGYNSGTQRAIAYFADTPISDITAADITKYLHRLARQNLSKKTVKNHKIIVSRIMHYATVECYIRSNPSHDAELPRNLAEKKRKPATPNEEILIKAAANDEWMLPYFALMTGMRRGEIFGLKWSDIDIDKGLIRVERSLWYASGSVPIEKSTKTEAGQRLIPILDPLKERLLLEIKTSKPNKNHYVFGDEKPISEKVYRHRYNMYKKRIGIDATIHQLRKSFATAAVDADVPPDVLKEIIGHKDISTTLNIYAEVRENRIKEAGAALSNMMKNNQ